MQVGDVLNFDSFMAYLKMPKNESLKFIMENISRGYIEPVYRPRTMSDEDNSPTGWDNKISNMPWSFSLKDGSIVSGRDIHNILIAFRVNSLEFLKEDNHGI